MPSNGVLYMLHTYVPNNRENDNRQIYEKSFNIQKLIISKNKYYNLKYVEDKIHQRVRILQYFKFLIYVKIRNF